MSQNIDHPISDRILIASHPTERRPIPTEPYLNISEFFCDTIQGENFVGWPATFLRVQDCTLNCSWCDTQEVWRYGNPYTFKELFDLIDKADLPRKFKEGQRLVLTGGSPLKQMKPLTAFLMEFRAAYGFKPFVEVENECTLIPDQPFINLVDLWNNSPKLGNSGNPRSKQFRPPVLQKLAGLKNSWFKFVVSREEDWAEIERDFLLTGLIKKSQVVLMPMGASIAELRLNRPVAVEMAIKNNVRYTTREHVVLWDKKTGV